MTFVNFGSHCIVRSLLLCRSRAISSSNENPRSLNAANSRHSSVRSKKPARHCMQLRDVVHEWVLKAKRDAESAQFLLDMYPPPLEIIGFHAEQAVEKSLKAVIVSKGFDPPRTHDLVFQKRLLTPPIYSRTSPRRSPLLARSARS